MTDFLIKVFKKENREIYKDMTNENVEGGIRR
jgi:hypothetical protein